MLQKVGAGETAGNVVSGVLSEQLAHALT